MKLAFKIDEVEKKSGSRSARGRLTKKFRPPGWQATKRLPALANENPAVETVKDSVKEIEPAPVGPVESLSSDSLQLYLNEIGQVKLLTPEEELSLAKRVKRGDKAAREKMITANLRLVVKIARDYEGLGLPLLDLINEGNIGLMKGVQRFDPRKGAKLSTYASLWIKQSIRRALSNHSKPIPLPVHVQDKMTRVRKAEMELHDTFDREPTDQELA